MENFLSLNLPQSLMTALKQMNFTKPTPIQMQAIPAALEGKDIIGSAQTGTGKTAAFGIPLVTKLLSDKDAIGLVMTPTRELATQVLQTLTGLLGKHSNIRTALLIGGDSIDRQLRQLQEGPRLLVGTPGRINDHLSRRSIDLRRTKFLVLDETDRMLDMGFDIQIEKIIKQMPKERQTLLFSATLPNNISALSDKYLKDPIRISINNNSVDSSKIKQEIVYVSEEEKYKELKKQLDAREGSVIIFVKTKIGAEKMAKRLCGDNHISNAIHGDLRQHKRDSVIKAFRNRKNRIMVATDIAARGLDIPHIEHVINYDLPQCPEDYIHRIGRTGRAGAEGEALCLLTPADKKKWQIIDRLMNPGSFKAEFRETKSIGRKSQAKPFKFRTNKTAAGKHNASRSSNNFGKKRLSKVAAK